MHRGFYAVKRPCSKNIEQTQNPDINQGLKLCYKKQNMEDSNPNINLINIYTFTKFGEILSICPKDIEQKQNSVVNQGP